MTGRPCIIGAEMCQARDSHDWQLGFREIRRGFSCARFCSGHRSCYDSLLRLTDQVGNSIWQDVYYKWTPGELHGPTRP